MSGETPAASRDQGGVWCCVGVNMYWYNGGVGIDHCVVGSVWCINTDASLQAFDDSLRVNVGGGVLGVRGGVVEGGGDGKGRRREKVERKERKTVRGAHYHFQH